jgi:hypothetical protein
MDTKVSGVFDQDTHLEGLGIAIKEYGPSMKRGLARVKEIIEQIEAAKNRASECKHKVAL